MIKNPKLRALIGTVLGACAGMSLCVSVLPLVLFQTGIGDEITLTYLLSRYVLPCMAIWAVGGWAVTRTDSIIRGGVVLSLTGLACAMMLMVLALHPAWNILLVGGVTGLVYGFLGGLLIARILEAAPPNKAEMS
ncbi:MAG: hypothetical protein GY780_05960 [bacterium]|nr:hypothetical protein [bacterium]